MGRTRCTCPTSVVWCIRPASGGPTPWQGAVRSRMSVSLRKHKIKWVWTWNYQNCVFLKMGILHFRNMWPETLFILECTVDAVFILEDMMQADNVFMFQLKVDLDFRVHALLRLIVQPLLVENLNCIGIVLVVAFVDFAEATAPQIQTVRWLESVILDCHSETAHSNILYLPIW